MTKLLSSNSRIQGLSLRTKKQRKRRLRKVLIRRQSPKRTLKSAPALSENQRRVDGLETREKK